MSADDHEIIWVSDAAISEKRTERSSLIVTWICLPVLPLVSKDCVRNAPATCCWNTEKKPKISLVNVTVFASLLAQTGSLRLCFLYCLCWHTFWICDQVEEIRAWSCCTNSSALEWPADSRGTSSVPWRILPKVLLPTKLWMNSEMTPGSWQSKRMRPLFLNLSVEMQ